MDARITGHTYVGSGEPKIFELDPTQVISLVRKESVYEGQYLELTTTQHLSYGTRLSYKLGDVLREYVITESESEYTGEGYVHTYTAPWTLYYDLRSSVMGGIPLSDGFTQNGLRRVYQFLNDPRDSMYEKSTNASGDIVYDDHYIGWLFLNSKKPNLFNDIDMSGYGVLYGIGGQSRWDVLLDAISRVEGINGAELLLAWPDIDLAVVNSDTALNVINRRYCFINYTLQGEAYSHWLEPGVNVSRLVRSVQDLEQYGRCFVIGHHRHMPENRGRGGYIPDFDDGYGGKKRWSGALRVSNGRGVRTTLQRLSGSTWQKHPKETSYYMCFDDLEMKSYYADHVLQSNDYDGKIYTTSSLNEVKSAALSELKAKNRQDPVEYQIELIDGADSMNIGDTAVIKADLPTFDGSSTKTAISAVVVGFTRDELTGKTSYTLGMAKGAHVPQINSRKTS